MEGSPILPATERKPVGALTLDRQVVPKAWLTRTEFYNDWVRPQDFHDCAVLTLVRDESRVGVLCLAAPERADAFGPQSLDLLRRLTPHLQRATEVTLKFAELEVFRSAAVEALDRLSEGVVLTDISARVLFANQTAEKMFAMADGIGVEGSSLRATSHARTVALRRAIVFAARREPLESAGGSLLLERPSGRRSLLVTIVPMRRETARYLVRPAAAIVFVADPEQESHRSEPRLQALYGMTRTEAAVAGLVSKGGGVKAAARKLGIAPSTARTHLHRIFDKTGTRGQAELAYLINKIIPVSSPVDT
jgi:DNA-binding CsgD family transcriptional regulator